MIWTNLRNCARCGGNHDKLEFRELTQPIDDYTYFASCPTNGEPILLRVTATQAGKPNRPTLETLLNQPPISFSISSQPRVAGQELVERINRSRLMNHGR